MMRLFARPGHVGATTGVPLRFAVNRDTVEITRELERRVRELQSV
jgi:hypothetical protein